MPARTKEEVAPEEVGASDAAFVVTAGRTMGRCVCVTGPVTVVTAGLGLAWWWWIRLRWTTFFLALWCTTAGWVAGGV